MLLVNVDGNVNVIDHIGTNDIVSLMTQISFNKTYL